MAKKSTIEKIADKTFKGAKRIWSQARKGLLTGILSAAAFLTVDGILGFLPDNFSNATKILVGIGIVVGVSLLGLDQKIKKT